MSVDNGSQEQQQTGAVASGVNDDQEALQTETPEIIRIKKKKRKPSKLKKAAWITFVTLTVLLGIGVGASALFLNSLNHSMSYGPKDTKLKDSLVVPQKQDPYYALLLGSDARHEGASSRSDVIILVRVDAPKGTVTMVGIPRDTKVEIKGHGTQKINAAYAFGGASGAVDAVSKFAGVDISHCAEIHFKELEQLVDMLDGVWVNVPISNNQTGRTNTGVTLSAGNHLLNGKQALAFSRERYGYLRGDYQRNDNQRILLEAIVKKVLAAPPMALPGLAQKMATCVSTDYSLKDLINLANEFRGGSGLKVYSCMAPSHSKTINGASYAITQRAEWTEMMRRVDAGGDPNAGVAPKTDAGSNAGAGSSNAGAAPKTM